MTTCQNLRLPTATEGEDESESDGTLSEIILICVSKKLTREWKNLGRVMGVTEAELEHIEIDKKEYGIQEMAYQMLVKWKNKTSDATVSALKQHLYQIDRNDIAENLNTSFAVGPSSIQDGGRQGQSGLNVTECEEWMENLKEKLKMEYLDLEMKGLPWMEELVLNLDEYYVDLTLIKMDRRGQELSSKPIDVNDIFKAVDGMDKPSRILVEGGPGLGKSTFAAKLAYDWAKGEPYIKHFDLVFLIPLRHSQGKLEEIISDTASIDKKDRKYLLQILNNKSKHVLALMDGCDEISPSFESEIQPVLRKKLYSHTTIVVTSRPGMFSAKRLQENETKFRTNADIVTNSFNFLQKRICIKGFNSEQRKKFVDIHTRDFSEQEKRNIASKLAQMVDKEFLKCPLFLLLLIVVLSENPNVSIVPTSRTDLYKHVFNCIIRRYFYKRDEPFVSDMDLFSMNVTLSDSEKPSYIKLMLQFSEFSLWSIRTNKLVFSSEDITKTCKGDSKLVELGFLAQSVSVAKMRRKLVYEPVHRSLLEFGAAYGIWIAFKQKSVDKDLTEKMISITPYKDSSILCLSFLLGLMGEEAGAIFNLLLPYKSFYSSSFESFLRCLPEININPTVLQSMSPFTPPRWETIWWYNVKENCLQEQYEEIVRYGLQAGSIKEILWIILNEDCIPSKTEIGSLTLYVVTPLATDCIQNIVKNYRQTKLRCKSLNVVLRSTEVHMTQFIQILSVIEYQHLTLQFSDICHPLIKEFIIGRTLNFNTIHRVYLESSVLDQPSVEMIDKMVKSNNVEQLVINVFKCDLKDQEPFDILCSSAAKATRLRGFTFLNRNSASPFKVDLVNLFDGGRESWDELGLVEVTVECTKEIAKEISVDRLHLLKSEVSEHAATLLGHCRILSLNCPVTLLHRRGLSWHMNETLSELNITFDATIERGVSPLFTQFRNLKIMALTMSRNCSLSVPFENWLFGSNDFVSLRGLEIWDIGCNPSLAVELVKGISGCVAQLPEIRNCKQKLELQYLLVTCLWRYNLPGSLFLDIISESKSALKHGDLPQLDFVPEEYETTSQELFKVFPVEDGFKIDCDLWETKDGDYIYCHHQEEMFEEMLHELPVKYSITFNESSKD